MVQKKMTMIVPTNALFQSTIASSLRWVARADTRVELASCAHDETTTLTSGLLLYLIVALPLIPLFDRPHKHPEDDNDANHDANTFGFFSSLSLSQYRLRPPRADHTIAQPFQTLGPGFYFFALDYRIIHDRSIFQK